MSKSYSEKFRPVTVKQLIGESQRRVAQGLLNSIENQTFRQEIMLCGPSGIGKTSIVYMCGKLLGVDKVDIETLNCGDDTGVDRIREFIRSMRFAPISGDYSIFYLDEIHNLTKNAQEAMLVEIEPVPSHVVLFASTTDPSKLIKTLRDRFDKHYLECPTEAEFKKKAKWICKSAGKEIDIATIEEIIAVSQGSVRSFDRDMQQAIEGTYKISELEEDNPKSLINLMLYQNVAIQDWFEAASRETEYIGLSVRMCDYCIKVLLNKKASPSHFIRSQIILQIMGEGLGRDMSTKVSFHRNLLRIFSEFSSR